MRSRIPSTEDLEQVGFDGSLIDANLRLDPKARALRNQAALDLLTALSELGNEIPGEPEGTTATTGRR